MGQKIVLLLSFFVLTSCATTSDDIDREIARRDSTIVVGKVEVFVNGSKEDIEETLFGKCLLTIENEGKTHKYRLDKSGEFYLEANPGAFYFKSLKCGTGMFAESGYVFYPAMPASVLEKGKINYVGDLKLNIEDGTAKNITFKPSKAEPVEVYEIEVETLGSELWEGLPQNMIDTPVGNYVANFEDNKMVLSISNNARLGGGGYSWEGILTFFRGGQTFVWGMYCNKAFQ